MAGAHRPVMAEILKISLSITLKEIRKKKSYSPLVKELKNKGKSQTTSCKVSKGRVREGVTNL